MIKSQLGDVLIIWWLGVISQLFFLGANSQNFDGQRLVDDKHQASGVQLVVLSNGIVNLTLSVPDGHVLGITYKGSKNLLETKNEEDNRGYWNVVWTSTSPENIMDKFPGTSYKFIAQRDDYEEISFTSTWKKDTEGVPLNIDKRFVMLKDSPGFYTYTVLKRSEEGPAFKIQEGRFLLKLQANKFHYMAISDERQRVMPSPEDRASGEVLDYKEAVVLTNPSNPELQGEVDDKYLYSCDNKDNKVHGWVGDEIGIWMITPSNEFRTGGPFKQDLTSHVGPTMLNMFTSTHYAGEDLAINFESTESWKKVIGPIYIYLNSDASAKTKPSILWDDAKHRAQNEATKWPYDFPLSKDFVKAQQRGAVSGQFHVHDWDKNKEATPAASAYVGLAPRGAVASWQYENKGYQFWTQTDDKGNFLIKNVIPGRYSLFAWVPGSLGDYKHASDITISPGCEDKARDVVFEAPRNGATLWEIGIADRTAAEFFIPDPKPKFKIYSYSQSVEKFRQYGLWTRYNDYYPEEDLVYTIGKSDYKRDWFFAHAARNVENKQYKPTTWKILFELNRVERDANYTLQLALAAASEAEIQVRFNSQKQNPDFTTKLIGEDNALARHGIHGLYHWYSINVSGDRLQSGRNTIFLRQARGNGPFRFVMYDYIRLEGPARRK